MQSFAVLCAKFHTILCKKIAIANSSLKNDIYLWRIFHKTICSRNVWVARFRTIF